MALAVAVGVAWSGSSPPRSSLADEPSATGPMRPVGEHGMIAEARAGERFTDGLAVLQVTGEEPARIVSVESVGGNGAFRQVGALLAGPGRKIGAVGYAAEFPPKDRALGDLVEAEGAVLQPVAQTRNEMAYELLVGYEVLDDTEVGYRAGLRVRYEVAGDEFVWNAPARLLFCPDGMETADCERVAEDDGWGE